jgi:hypothetical protein
MDMNLAGAGLPANYGTATVQCSLDVIVIERALHQHFCSVVTDPSALSLVS